MRKVPPETVERRNVQEIVVDPPAESGWLVIPEAFHPDWRATQAGRVLQIARAYGAFLAVRLDGTAGAIAIIFPATMVVFRLRMDKPCGLARRRCPPDCARGSRSAGGLADVLAARAPPPGESLQLPPSELAHRSPSGKVLVIIPTYNEAPGIGSILEKTLIADPSLEIRCRR